MEVAGANRRWRGQFRCRGSRRESAVAQLFSLIWLNNVKRAVVCFPKSCFHFPAGFTTNYSESAAGTPWLRFQCWDAWVHSQRLPTAKLSTGHGPRRRWVSV